MVKPSHHINSTHKLDYTEKQTIPRDIFFFFNIFFPIMLRMTLIYNKAQLGALNRCHPQTAIQGILQLLSTEEWDRIAQTKHFHKTGSANNICWAGGQRGPPAVVSGESSHEEQGAHQHLGQNSKSSKSRSQSPLLVTLACSNGEYLQSSACIVIIRSQRGHQETAVTYTHLWL